MYRDLGLDEGIKKPYKYHKYSVSQRLLQRELQVFGRKHGMSHELIDFASHYWASGFRYEEDVRYFNKEGYHKPISFKQYKGICKIWERSLDRYVDRYAKEQGV